MPGERDQRTAYWRAFVRYSVLLTILWFAVYGGTNWITGLHSYRVAVHVEAELNIPFIPSAVIVYLSLFPMLMLAPLVLKSHATLHRFAKALAWTIVISGIGFLTLPAEEAHTPGSKDGLVGRLFDLADWMNLSFNYFPSLHVGMATVCAVACGRETSPMGALLTAIWAAAIAASTLLTHQHYVADVVAGAAIGLAVGVKVCGKAEPSGKTFGRRHGLRNVRGRRDLPA